TLNHDLTTDVNVTGTAFSWSAADNPNVTGETTANSTDTSITDTLINISGAVQTVIYTITPTSPDGCIGDDYTFTVTINPKPFVATAPTQTICSNTTLNYDLTVDVNVTGTTFSWSAADNPNVTGETTVLTTTNLITDTLVNISGVIQTVIYTITPISPDGCDGDDYTFTVTINPEPYVATEPTETICSNTTLNHDLTADVNVIGTFFIWSAADNPNVTGETTTVTSNNLITDTLVNISGIVQTVIYTITPIVPDGCGGDNFTYTVTIYPEPITIITPTQTICSDASLNHDLTTDVNITSTTFNWSATDNPNVTGETTTNSTNTSITDTLVNISGAVQTVIYTITPTSPDGCLGNDYTFTVTVNPKPFVATAPTQTICSDTTLNHDLTADVNVTGTTFSWSATDNPNVTGETTTNSTDTSITDTLINISGTAQTVIYTITPTSPDGCVGDDYTFTVTINPKPLVATTPTQTICSDDTLNHDLTTDVNISGTTFSWSAADNPNVTGETTTNSTDTSITDTLVNISGTVQTVIYTITPTSPDGCIGDDYTFTVTINPKPYVATAPTQTICSDASLNHDLTADVNITSTTFNWNATDNPNVTGETTANSTVISITDTLINISGTVQTVIYTITPISSDGCIGEDYTFTVTVNPKPLVTTAPTQTICGDDTLNHDLTADVNVTGTIFNWSAANNPNVTGETTTNSTNTSITDTLINTSGIVQTVIYTITPTSPDGCIGEDYTFTVTVNPRPFIAIAPTQTICSDTTLNHNLTTDVNISGTTFSWSATDNPDVTGETTSNSTNTSITDTLVNISGTVQTVIYTIMSTSPDGCLGDDYTFTVTVNPKPYVATAPTQTICGDDTLNHHLTADVNVIGTTFSWSAADNPNVMGETTVNSTNTSITDTLVNISGTVQTVIYTIIPISPDGCLGDDYTFTVTVNPKPSVTTAPTQAICSDTTLNHNLTTDVNISGATFNWSATDNPNVTGETTTNSTNTSITDTLVNISGTVQTVIYTITPTSPDGCVGDNYTFTVTVNPKPYVATAPTQTICSEATLNYDLTADVNVIGTTFSWSAADNPNVTGETTTNSTNTNITDTLVNVSGMVQTVIYTITPTSLDGCIGDNYTLTVTVNPEPFVANLPTDIICSNTTLNHDLSLDVNITGASFNWFAVDNPNVIGETTLNSTNSLITDTLINTSNTVQIVTYIIEPTSIFGCAPNPFAFTYEVTITPESQLNFSKTYANTPDGNYDTVGEIIEYQIIIENLNQDPIENITINDPNADPGSITPSSIAIIQGSESVVITASHTITQQDLDNGQVINQAEVTIGSSCPQSSIFVSDDPNTVALNDPTITPLDQNPALELTKASDVAPDGLWDTVGEVITYTLEVTNTGNTTLIDLVISDPNADPGSISPNTINTLLPGESVIVVAAHTITQSDLNTGFVINSASVAAQDSLGNTISDDSDDPNNPDDIDNNGDGEPDDPTITLTPQLATIEILKVVDTNTYDMVGDVLNYTITVTNTGNVTLLDIDVQDPIVEFTSPSTIDSLEPNETLVLTAQHTVTLDDLTNGSIVNTALVNATISNSTIVITEDSDDPTDPTDIDLDNDGDPEDPTISYGDTDGDGISNNIDLDDDNDGITDIEEQNGDLSLDTDGDGIIDSLDLDADGDGIYDYIEAGHTGIDSDGDGRIDGPFGTDGIPDSVQDIPDNGDVSYTPQDSDNDGIHDFQDIDDDNDGLLTEDENPDPDGNMVPDDAFDSDGDGTPDYLDPNNGDINAEDEIEVFNAITPNGDGDNDVFVIRNIEKFPNNELKIFNRWGTIVYRAQGYGQQQKFFRGESSGRATLNKENMLPVGTYFYVLEYKNERGITKNRSGYLYINR
ncbi:PKD-like domain-containing protein, partial [Aquimarina sp. 2201CG5-10]|uniref:PKD-like domain-containing protein n=1 Tax=Aquimarina callyspongiae TaxID=3098150 RepID=UPI002AB5DAEB